MPENEIRMLYCGMSDDIMHPLLLESNVNIIYSISKFDKAYSSCGTWESQKEDIMRTLRTGRKKCYSDEEIHGNKIGYHMLVGKSKIIKEHDDKTNKIWRVKFMYNDVIRGLVYYYERDFMIDWPDEIQNVSYVTGVGAFDIQMLCGENGAIFRNMLKERCHSEFRLCALEFSSKIWAEYYEKIVLKEGKHRKGEKNALFTVNNDNFDEIFDRGFADGS